MILEEPLSDPNSTFNHVLKDVNIVITIIFTIEMIIKIIVFGLLFNGGNSYLRNGWNTLDCFIVVPKTPHGGVGPEPSWNKNGATGCATAA